MDNTTKCLIYFVNFKDRNRIGLNFKETRNHQFIHFVNQGNSLSVNVNHQSKQSLDIPQDSIKRSQPLQTNGIIFSARCALSRDHEQTKQTHFCSARVSSSDCPSRTSSLSLGQARNHHH